MRSRFLFSAILIVALAPGNSACLASELTVRMPSTAFAVRSRDLLDHAVSAFLAREGASHVTQLWVFPTARASTVFIHCLTKSTERLVLVEMNGERIATVEELK